MGIYDQHGIYLSWKPLCVFPPPPLPLSCCNITWVAQHLTSQCEFCLSSIVLKKIHSLIFSLSVFVCFLSFFLSLRWVATQSRHPSPSASSSPLNLHHSLLLLHSPSTVYPSQRHGTSSSVSQTLRTSVLLSAAFTNASLSSPSHSKVGVSSHFLCGLMCLFTCANYNHMCVCRTKMETSVSGFMHIINRQAYTPLEIQTIWHWSAVFQ